MRTEESLSTRRALQVQLLIWAGFVVLLYYIHDQTWLEDFGRDIPMVARALWVHVVAKALWVIGFWIVGYSAGRAVLDLLRVSSRLEGVIDDVLYSTATGWGVVGIGAFILGSLGILNWPVHVGLSVLLVALFHRRLIALRHRLARELGGGEFAHVELFLLLTIVAVALWGLGLYFLPEYGTEALGGYLYTARLYMEEGRISFHPEIGFINFPQTVQMWFMESMMVIPGGAGGLTMGLCHLLATLGVFALSRRFFGRGPALIASLMYLLMSETYIKSTVSYPDQGLILMVILGFYGFLTYLEKPSRQAAVLAGLMFGFASGISYVALVIVLVVAVVGIGWTLASRRRFAALMHDAWPGVIAFLVVCAPWSIRNIYWFGNPLFPLFTDLFPGGRSMYAAFVDDMAVDLGTMLRELGTNTGRSALGFIVLPYTIAFAPYGSETAGVGGVGPWTLVALPFAILLRRFPKVLWAMLALIVLTFAWWWFVEGALLLPTVLPVFGLCTAMSGFILWHSLSLENVRVKGILGWMIMGVAFAALVSFFSGSVTPASVRGKMPLFANSRQQFVTQLLPGLAEIDELNDRFELQGVGDQVRVYGLYADEYRWFADFSIIGNRFGYADYADYMNHTSSAADLYGWLKGYDIDYLLINAARARSQLGDAVANAVPTWFPDWQFYFERLSSENRIYVFRLK